MTAQDDAQLALETANTQLLAQQATLDSLVSQAAKVLAEVTAIKTLSDSEAAAITSLQAELDAALANGGGAVTPGLQNAVATVTATVAASQQKITDLQTGLTAIDAVNPDAPVA